MRDAAQRALEIAQGKSVAELQPEDETALALVRLLEILGEAARMVSGDLKLNHSEVPWREIADTRNRLIHQYFDVDMEIVSAIVQADLPDLLQKIEGILKET
ncbi:HepT-like ribonuclease domain-containing protein [Meiothermus sp. CFH 77666]|uniref:HepT-like ribonuclease domain-containing protein n=1 Tax=Meiothermus sp. CFH 77666 TaxID=2817942 RepID=UPI001FB0F44E|nr:HepT-like ribonuclease domain-containing protein [Meiothermus sp. CFH 77666]